MPHAASAQGFARAVAIQDPDDGEGEWGKDPMSAAGDRQGDAGEGLRRTLSFWDAMFLITGTMIGRSGAGSCGELRRPRSY